MTGDIRLANEAWESLFRAQVVLMREFSADDVWIEITQNEYDVLYTISKAPDGISMVEINRGILMTQGGISRLIARLEQRGLLERCTDPLDARATRVTLTEEGVRIQRSVGRAHASSVARAMTAALSHEQLEQLRDLGRDITRIFDPTNDTTSTKQPVTS